MIWCLVLTWLMTFASRFRVLTSVLKVGRLHLKRLKILRSLIFLDRLVLLINGRPLVILFCYRVAVFPIRLKELLLASSLIRYVFGCIANLVKRWPIGLATPVYVAVINTVGWWPKLSSTHGAHETRNHESARGDLADCLFSIELWNLYITIIAAIVIF